MQNYDSLIQAIDDLKKRGYVEDFEIKPDGLQCNRLDLWLTPEDFIIEEFYRFEGDSNPDDSSIIYAISSKEGVKGTIADAYGAYAENINTRLAEKLQIKPAF